MWNSRPARVAEAPSVLLTSLFKKGEGLQQRDCDGRGFYCRIVLVLIHEKDNENFFFTRFIHLPFVVA